MFGFDRIDESVGPRLFDFGFVSAWLGGFGLRRDLLPV
jgi:hypothetical protein